MAAVTQHRTRMGLLGGLMSVMALLAVSWPAASPASAATTVWPLRFADGFNGTSLSSNWAVLDGNASPHFWAARQGSVHNGMLSLGTSYNSTTGHWESGSVVLKNSGALYGAIQARVRCSAGSSKCVG